MADGPADPYSAVQQCGSHHWPFTPERNAQGDIDPPRLLDAIRTQRSQPGESCSPWRSATGRTIRMNTNWRTISALRCGIGEVGGPMNEARLSCAVVRRRRRGCSALERVDPAEVRALIDRLVSARRVFVFAVGRVFLALQCLAKRLAHLGFDSTWSARSPNPPSVPRTCCSWRADRARPFAGRDRPLGQEHGASFA